MQDLTAVGLVLVSAAMHALWNFLLKGVRGPRLVGYWWSMMVTMVVFLPYFLIATDWQALASINWIVVIVSGSLKAGYIAMLSDVYSRGDLSLVYPIVRSSHLFVPFLAYYFLDESIGLFVFLGLVVITVGLFVLHIQDGEQGRAKETLAAIRRPATLVALGTAFVVALYSVLDKVGVTNLSAITFMYLMFLVMVVVLTPFVVLRTDRSELVRSLRSGRWNLVGIAVFDWGGYLLVLLAMQLTEVSRVAAVRQSSVVFGVLLGWYVLKEPSGWQRVVGALVIFGGIFLVTWGG